MTEVIEHCNKCRCTACALPNIVSSHLDQCIGPTYIQQGRMCGYIDTIVRTYCVQACRQLATYCKRSSVSQSHIQRVRLPSYCSSLIVVLFCVTASIHHGGLVLCFLLQSVCVCREGQEDGPFSVICGSIRQVHYICKHLHTLF